MSGKIVILTLPGETIAGRFDGDRLESLFVQRDDKPTLAGALFWGRIASLDKKNNTAFVDLGLGQDAFLPLSDAPRSVSQGQLLPLSVTREAVEDKGPRVTARLSKEAEARLPAKLPQRVGPLFLAHSLQAWLAAQPALGPAIEAFADPLAQRLEAEIENLLGAFVALPGGASLLVEPVRTLTAIDVNAGPLDPLSANRAAVPEIARQILLRNLAGRLVIDFIALGDKRRRDGLQAALKAALGNERPCKVGAFEASGLCEITRQRLGPALHELLCDRVGEGGCGWSPSAKTLAFRALRQALRQGAKSRLSLAAHPLILAAVKAEAAARKIVEERLGLTLALQEQRSWPPGRWEII